MNRLTRFLALLKKEFIQLLKNPKTRLTVFLPPLLQMFLLGYAATMDLKDVPFSVLDHANTQESRELIASFAGNRVFHLHAPLQSELDMQRRISEQEIKLALVIPENFSRELANRRSPQVQVIVDGRNSSSAGIALGYVTNVIMAFNQTHFPETTHGIRITTRGWFNPNYEARWFMVPSLLAILILLALTLLVSLSFAKEREAGTMDQLLLTPYSSVELLAAKGLSAVLIGLCQLTFCMVLVLFWFQVPYVSSFWLLYLLFLTFLMASAGMGLAVSVFCANMQQAMIVTFLIAVPFAMLSGMATPVASMPDVIQTAMLVNPVRHSIEALHRLFLEGATFRDILPTYLILSGLGCSMFALACFSLAWQRRH